MVEDDVVPVFPNGPAAKMDESALVSWGSRCRSRGDLDPDAVPEGSCIVEPEEDVVAVFVCLKAEVTDGVGNHTFLDQAYFVLDFALIEEPHKELQPFHTKSGSSRLGADRDWIIV